MIALLKSIPGPQFLILYPALLVIMLTAARLLLRQGGGAALPPDPSRFSPVALAVLRGGWPQALKTALFSLWQRGAVELTDTTAHDLRFKRNPESAPPTDRFERALWGFLKDERRPADFLNHRQLRAFTESHCRKLEGEFERLRLLKDRAAKRLGWQTTIAVLGVAYALGGSKCYLGLTHHKPTGFLIVLLVVTLPVVLWTLQPWQRLTPQGIAYQKRLEEHFAWLKAELAETEKPALDPAYAVAIFGPAVVAGSLLFATFSNAFPAPMNSGGWNNSGHDRSGGCSSSSCSGGGCGGGCGGCGGD